MSSITINSNNSALLAWRRLNLSTERLRQTYTRLSSGLRINRAGDDASGLAISQALATDAYVYAQGIRNVNDAASLLNIAEAGLSELSSLLVRRRELATQAANGTLSFAQRKALHQEAEDLGKEFDRIVYSTKFNGRQLFDVTSNEIRVQGGYGNGGTITIEVGALFQRTVGNENFHSTVAYNGGAEPFGVHIADVNGDGKEDLISASRGDNSVAVLLGNGDGTFAAPSLYEGGRQPYRVRTADLDGDGSLDLITSARVDNAIHVYFNNGDGSFKAPAKYDAGGDLPTDFLLGDVNNDGQIDILTDIDGTAFGVLLGNGDGSFKAAVSYLGDARLGDNLADVNLDGILDVLTVESNGSGFGIVLGNGDGSFRSPVMFESHSSAKAASFVDVNNDGLPDVIVASRNEGLINVMLGNGDGSFQGRITYRFTNDTFAEPDLVIEDMNGDGISDLVLSSFEYDAVHVLFGNADGSFSAAKSFAGGQGVQVVRTGDLNGDGAMDIATASRHDAAINVLLADTEQSVMIERVRLYTKEEALEAMKVTERGIERVLAELGAIGAAQSRLTTALSTLQQSRENLTAAASRISEADIATETAELVRVQILQESGLAVLSQANAMPELALRLLDSAG